MQTEGWSQKKDHKPRTTLNGGLLDEDHLYSPGGTFVGGCGVGSGSPWSSESMSAGVFSEIQSRYGILFKEICVREDLLLENTDIDKYI